MARTPKVVEDRREQIIEAAMRVFSQKGFTKATNKDIAREAGITPGLIYYYFESKEALLGAILESKSPVQVLTALPPDLLSWPVEEVLRFLALRVLTIVEGEDFVGMVRVMLPEVIYNPEMSSVVASFIQRVFTFLTGYLQTKMDAGELRHTDASFVAQAFAGSVMSFVLRRQILRDPLALQYTHEQIASAVVELVLEGLKPR
jgi:AcrR family transcriptional regulator